MNGSQKEGRLYNDRLKWTKDGGREPREAYYVNFYVDYVSMWSIFSYRRLRRNYTKNY